MAREGLGLVASEMARVTKTARMKHGAESERRPSNVQGTGASAGDVEESLSDISDIADGEAASADEGAPADDGHCTHHAATKSSRTASGAYRERSPASSSAPPSAADRAAEAKSGRTAPTESSDAAAKSGRTASPAMGEPPAKRRRQGNDLAARPAPCLMASSDAAAKSGRTAPRDWESQSTWQRQGGEGEATQSQRGGAGFFETSRAAAHDEQDVDAHPREPLRWSGNYNDLATTWTCGQAMPMEAVVRRAARWSSRLRRSYATEKE